MIVSQNKIKLYAFINSFHPVSETTYIYNELDHIWAKRSTTHIREFVRDLLVGMHGVYSDIVFFIRDSLFFHII